MSTQSLNDKAFPVQGQSVEKKKKSLPPKAAGTLPQRGETVLRALFTKKPTILAQELTACGFEKKRKKACRCYGREREKNRCDT